MSLKRQIERMNIKKQCADSANQVKTLIRINGNLHGINEKMNKNINELYTELQFMKEVIAALVITDIRNHNFTAIENKKVISIPSSFLFQVAKEYAVKMYTFDNVLIIEPEKIMTNDDVEDVTGM